MGQLRYCFDGWRICQCRYYGQRNGAGVRTLADGYRIAAHLSRQSVRLKRNRRATGQRRRLCAQSWAATGQRLARQSIRTPLTGTGAAQTAARSWRGGMIDLIEQWNNNTHIGVCVLFVFLLSVFMLYLYMWGEIGGGNRGEIGGASLNHAARRFF